MSVQATEPVLLDAVLRPNAPLDGRHLRIILAAIACINVAFGAAFVLKGAWLVTPFMGLDLGLLAWAFQASKRAGLKSERVTVTPSSLVVEKSPARGPRSRIALNPYWVRVDIAEPVGHGSQLTLWSHGRGVRLGTFLAPEERAALALELKIALRRARELPPSID